MHNGLSHYGKRGSNKAKKFLANEIEKESNDTFDMRKEECEEMMRVWQRKTIRCWKRERWVDA